MSAPFHPLLMPLLRKLAYWSEFSAADKQAILDLPYRTKLLERHNYIVHERAETTHSCLMLSGFAIRHKMVAGGARQIVAIHMTGDLVDLQNSFLGFADHGVQVIAKSKVAFIPREAIKKLALERPRVGMAMWYDTLVDGSVFREWIANVGRRDAQTRMAHLLCELSLRLKLAGLGEETAYTMPMTQEQLADTTGLTAVHVNRTLMALEAQGLIARHSSRSFIIRDWKKLAAAGDFDSNYLHLREKGKALQ